MITLWIETSCDDTSLSIVEYADWNFIVHELVAYSQIADHQWFWWVVPEVAYRIHHEKIMSVYQQISFWMSKIDTISVTTHPWLPWSLIVWKAFASFLSEFYQKKKIEVNHIHWHLSSVWLDRNFSEIAMPMVCLSASWGHNELYLLDHDINQQQYADRHCEKIWKMIVIKLGTTLDDASGECFDKVSRMLWWPYPWWPWISTIAKNATDISEFWFKKILLDQHENRWNFSFSWMKSLVHQLISKQEKTWISFSESQISNIAYSFQEAVVDTLISKVLDASDYFWVSTISIVWWVSANDRLFEKIQLKTDKNIFRPTKKSYSMDNWAMIWAAWLIYEMSLD